MKPQANEDSCSENKAGGVRGCHNLDSEIESSYITQKVFRVFKTIGELQVWRHEEAKRIQCGYSQSNASMTSTFQPRKLENEKVTQEQVNLLDIIYKFKVLNEQYHKG